MSRTSRSPTIQVPPFGGNASSASSSSSDAAANASSGFCPTSPARVQTLSRAAATSSLSRPLMTERGWSSGSHPATANSSRLCRTSHCSRRSPLRSVRTSTKRPRSFSPCRSRCSSPASKRRGGIIAVVEVPRATVPDDDVAAPVLAPGDHTLEVEVLERMVLDVHGQVALAGVEGEPLRNCPAHQHTVDLEPEVVVQAPAPGGAAPRTAGGRRRSVTAPLVSGGFGRATKSRLLRYRSSDRGVALRGTTRFYPDRSSWDRSGVMRGDPGYLRRSTARWSWALFMYERPSMFMRFASS